MLYIKYRPQQFNDLQNLESVKKTLLSQLKQKKVGHAYLFTGPKGTGKTTTARLLAKAVNCIDLKEGEPCLSCENCQALHAGRFLDLIEIDAASNRGIDDVRALREKVKLSPVSGDYKIYIIDEVHMLTKEAFNALLKTLEEPPKHIIFILCTTEPSKVLPTVVSRCQRFNFKRAHTGDIVKRLSKICAKEQANVDSKVLEKIALAASGGYRDAETILEQIITGEQTVEGLLGIIGDYPISDFVESLSVSDIPGSLVLLNKYHSEGLDLEIFTRGLLKFLRDLLFIKMDIGEIILDSSSEGYERKQILARNFSEEELDNLITLCTHVEGEIRHTSIPQLPLELLAVRFSQGRVPFEERLSSEDKNSASDRQVNSSDLGTLKKQWEDLLAKIKTHNHSIEALLKSCTIEDFDGEILTLKTCYRFHQERLESGKNRILLEEIISEYFKSNIKVRCILGKRQEEEKIKSKLGTPKSTLEVFSGELF